MLLEVTAEPECKRQNLVEVLHILESEKAGLEVDFNSSIPEAEYGAEVDMSPNDLGRLIFDLLDNAKKAGATEARVRALLLDGKLAICVKDNGPGFKGLDRLEASRLSRAAGAEHGNGIGICEEICFKAGGMLILMDKDDTTGAEFLISLPIRAAVRH
jgi:signal transduction histidine kinase